MVPKQAREKAGTARLLSERDPTRQEPYKSSVLHRHMPPATISGYHHDSCSRITIWLGVRLGNKTTKCATKQTFVSQPTGGLVLGGGG